MPLAGAKSHQLQGQGRIRRKSVGRDCCSLHPAPAYGTLMSSGPADLYPPAWHACRDSGAGVPPLPQAGAHTCRGVHHVPQDQGVKQRQGQHAGTQHITWHWQPGSLCAVFCCASSMRLWFVLPLPLLPVAVGIGAQWLHKAKPSAAAAMVIAALSPAAPFTLSLASPIPIRCQERWGDAARKLADILNDDMFRSLEGKSKHQLWLELCDMITKHPKVRGCCCRACDQTGTHPQRARLAASVQGCGFLVLLMKGPGDVVQYMGCLRGYFSL